jgi:FMN phosphatase YigB (HAD superfamily)
MKNRKVIDRMQKKLIIFTDSGDTIVDEGTEIRDERGIVIHAGMLPGAEETMEALYNEGYTIALVADGEEQSFINVYEENGLGYIFSSRTISEIVGIEKPATAMFVDAMKKNWLIEKDKKRIVMIGNNIKKDIAGANQFGITSILLDWSPRYNMTPESPNQIPDYIVHNPKELMPLIDKLNKNI